jgi:hypothetical protein
MRVHLAIGALATSMLMACAASPDAPGDDEEVEAEEVGVDQAAACDWAAQGRTMDRYTRMCQSWGYDQGVFRFNKDCSVTLQHCIHW